jgi:hypothetical protein
MMSNKEVFAWVKVMPKGTSTEELPCDATTPKCPTLTTESGDRPPRVAALKSATAAAATPGYPKGVTECCDLGVRRLFGTLEEHGRLAIDTTHNGFGGWVFEVAQFVGSRDEAVEWLTNTAEGKAWRKKSPSLALMSFLLPTKLCLGNEVGAQTVSQASAAQTCPSFKLGDWAKRYRELLAAPTALFGDAELRRFVLQAYDALEPLQGVDECAVVKRRVDDEQKAKLQAIQDQADTSQAMMYVAFDRDDPYDRPDSLRLLDALRVELARPIFEVKLLFSRGRPWTCCKGLSIALPGDDGRFPQHPAFPAGHAAFVYALAFLMAEAVPAQKDAFMRRADEVADNRIVGGFHWPSDIEAGRKLAEMLVAEIRTSPLIEPLLKLIPSEWASAP